MDREWCKTQLNYQDDEDDNSLDDRYDYEVNDLRGSSDGDVDLTHPPSCLVIVEIHQVPANMTFISISICLSGFWTCPRLLQSC